MGQIKEEKLVPELRFPEFIGDFEIKKISQVFSLFNGYAFPSGNYSDDGCRWVKIADVGITKMNNQTPSYLPIEFKGKYRKFILKKGDYVVALTRPILSGRLKIAPINLEYDESLLNQRVGKIVTDNNTEFVYQLLQRSELISKIENRIAGTDPPNLSPNEINRIKIFVPNLPEQQKIATFLTSVDKRIQLLSQKKEKLEEYKKGVMQKVFKHDLPDYQDALDLKEEKSGQSEKSQKSRFRLRFKDGTSTSLNAGNGNSYPDWEEKKLGEVFEFINTNSFSRSLLNYEKGGVKNIHYGDIHTKFKSCFDNTKERVPFINEDVNLSNFKGNQFCKEGDLVIADASEDYKDIGKAIEIINLNNQRLVAGLHTYIARAKNKMAIGFKAYLMQSEYIRKQVMKIASGISVLGISKGNLSKITILVPAIEEQQKIATFLSALDKQIEQVAGQVEKMKEWKKGLLQVMFV